MSKLSDIFKIVQEIDKQGIDDIDDFLNKCIDEWMEEEKKHLRH